MLHRACIDFLYCCTGSRFAFSCAADLPSPTSSTSFCSLISSMLSVLLICTKRLLVNNSFDLWLVEMLVHTGRTQWLFIRFGKRFLQPYRSNRQTIGLRNHKNFLLLTQKLNLSLSLCLVPYQFQLWRSSWIWWREIRVSVLFISDAGDLCYQQGE